MVWPKLFGLIGVLTLTATGIYYATQGKSAFTETTAAVFFIGAFILSALVAIHQKLGTLEFNKAEPVSQGKPIDDHHRREPNL